jgi:sugar phosphate isomerase/epimerase
VKKNLRFGIPPHPRIEIVKEIRFISKLGFDYVELHTADWLRNKQAEILNETRNLKLELIGHLPDGDLCDPNPNRNQELLKTFSEGIDVFHEFGIQKVIVHAYVGREVDISKYSKFELTNFKLERLKELTAKCKNIRIKLCLENTDENPEDLDIFFKELPSLFFCLDVGHANLFTEKNKSLKFLEKFGQRLAHIHISDNFGGNSENHDLHLPIGTGKIKLKPILQHIKKIAYDDTITLEIVTKYRNEYLKTSKKILKKLLDEV